MKYFLQKCAFTGFFVGFLILLSWWYGQSSPERRSDPVQIAHEERDAAIKECGQWQRAWEEMGTKHERDLKRILELQDEFSRAYKDLPWLNQRSAELAEETVVQYNEIERLKVVQQKYDELLDQVATYGMTAKRPESYQKLAEDNQRLLEITKHHLQNSEKEVKSLREKLVAQEEKTNKEKAWLQERLKKNSRSAAYNSKFGTSGRTLESNPVWGVRCACTQPEIAYGLKDQSPRIAELEAIVVARDQSIMRLRASRGNVLKSNTASLSNIDTAPLVHACEHEQQYKDLSKKVADDAETIRQLRKQCQDLKDAASIEVTANTAEVDDKAKLEGDLTAKDAVIEKLQGEKITMNEDLAAKNKEIDDLREEKKAVEEDAVTKISNRDQELIDSRRDLGDARRISAEYKITINELQNAQGELKTALEQKDVEIQELEEANQEIACQPARESPEALERLEAVHTDLDKLRRQLTECKVESDRQIVRIQGLEVAGRELEATTKLKDDRTQELEVAGRELEATNKLKDDRIQELEVAGRELEATTKLKDDRIQALEVAGRDLEETTKLKDNRIVTLEEQINEAPTRDFVEQQNQAIGQKDREYHKLYHHYYLELDNKARAEKQRDEVVQAYNTLQQNDTAKQLELQRLFNKYKTLHDLRADDERQVTDLRNQLRQRTNDHTDLQVKYNNQATELDTANSVARELRSKIANLEQANSGQINTPSDTDAEKFRLEGENRARPVWQANIDQVLSAQASKLEQRELDLFKLEKQLQQLKNQTNPLREINLKSREDAIKAREDALQLDADVMEHDQQTSTSKADPEIKTMQSKLAAANKEAGDAKVRNRGIQNQLNKERKERKDEKEKHERELKKEQEEAKKRSDVMKLRLEKENPLKGLVSDLQNKVARLTKELEEQRSR